MWLITEFKYLLVEGYPQILDGLKYAYPQFSGMTTEQWLSIDVNIRQHFANQIASNSEELKKLLYMWRGITYQKEREENRRDPYLYNAQRQLNKSEPFCNLTKPQCGKGEELIHGFYKEPKWVNSFGWFCQKCQHGFYKEVVGNDKCGECFGFYETNFERTTCFDPYQDQYIKMDQLDVILISSLVYILILLINFALAKVLR
ncbi:uncharacterized protein [Clytia hemisphaerica]|uniref:uncharacterized protein n=1 Tax=Clytia hemisphaerica TaxID=252671 RepID=UPI0034D4A6FB